MQESDIDKLLTSIFSDDNSLNIREMFNEKLETLNVSKTKVLSLLKIDKDVFEQIINGTAKQPNLIHIIKIANFLSTMDQKTETLNQQITKTKTFKKGLLQQMFV